MEAMTDEQLRADREYVEAAWERVLVCDGSYRHYLRGTILINWANHQFYEFDSWAAARAFTEQRKQEIRHIEEEIEQTNQSLATANNYVHLDWDAGDLDLARWIRRRDVYIRILGRLTAALATANALRKSAKESV